MLLDWALELSLVGIGTNGNETALSNFMQNKFKIIFVFDHDWQRL